MKKMKYVLNSENGHFLLMPSEVGMMHSDAFTEKWTNAGFVLFTANEKDECGNIIFRPECFGKSESLGLSHGLNDADIIYRGIKDNF